MKPVNQTERTRAINKFLLGYGCSLLVVLLCAWLLFHIPTGVFRNIIQNYKTEEEEQMKLVNKIDGITVNVKNIAQTDQSYQSSTNDIEKGSLLANLQQYQKDINDALVEVKNDSASFNSAITKKNAYNYIVAFNSILAYRNTLADLQKSLAEKGGEAAELLRVKTMLETCNTQLELYKTLAAANKPAPAPAPAPSPGGGGSGNKAKEEALQKQLDQAMADLTACQKAKGAAPPTTNLDEAKKAAVMFDMGQDLYNTASKTKNLIEKRGILSAAKMVFQKSQDAYPDPDKVKKAIMQIDAELKRLSNIG